MKTDNFEESRINDINKQKQSLSNVKTNVGCATYQNVATFAFHKKTVGCHQKR
mgnify:CR=1 FL=1